MGKQEIPCVHCGSSSKSVGPVSRKRVCLPCYQKERKQLPPVPDSSEQLRVLPPPRRPCAMCGRPARGWVFDPYEGDPIRLKEGVLVDVRPFRERFSRDDYAAVCGRNACLEEFDLDRDVWLERRGVYLELLLSRVREGTLTPKQLPEILAVVS